MESRNERRWEFSHKERIDRKSDSPEISIPALVAAYPTKGANGRVFMLIALAQLGPSARSALPTMKEALNDRNSDVRRVAAFALKKIDPRNAGSVQSSGSRGGVS